MTPRFLEKFNHLIMPQYFDSLCQPRKVSLSTNPASLSTNSGLIRARDPFEDAAFDGVAVEVAEVEAGAAGVSSREKAR
jgi:hypothetical protein